MTPPDPRTDEEIDTVMKRPTTLRGLARVAANRLTAYARKAPTQATSVKRALKQSGRTSTRTR